MMYISFEKGWLPVRFRSGQEFGKPLTKLEILLHFLSRVKWMNVSMAFLILMGFGYGVVSIAKNVVSAYPAWQEEKHVQYVQEELAKYEQVEVVIQKGDTAWTIQEKLTPNAHDLRHPLYLSEEINGEVDWGNLLPGQKLIFLKAKSNK